jgi:hypothetical protein
MDDQQKTLSSARDLIPCLACCCCITACYYDWPECCGCRIKQAFMCCTCEYMACKPTCECCGEVNPQLKEGNPGTLCLCCEGSGLCINPDTCCSGTIQCCCMDQRLAFPPGQRTDVPCVVSLLFCTCCYNNHFRGAFCTTLGAMDDATVYDGDGGAPATVLSDNSAPRTEIITSHS